jgi:phage terminase large subunit-like protein
MPLPDCWTSLPLQNLLALERRLSWIKTARPEQLTPVGDWRYWLIMAGRGWGKTRTGAEDLAHYALWHAGSRLAVIAPTAADARDICIEGESGLLQVLPQACIRAWHRSHGNLILTNGTRIKLYSAEQPERLRGPQHHRVWCDELAAWERPEAFDQMLFGLRLGSKPQAVLTTTPRPTELMRALVERAGDDLHLTRGRTQDNAAHLSAAALATLHERYAGTRLGRQELEAELLDLTEGALWQRESMPPPVATLPTMRRVIVAIDPALQSESASDETGIIAAGLGEDGFYYVLADLSGRYPSDVWAAKAAQLAEEWQADSIRVEVNVGGALLTRILQHYAPKIRCEAVYAAHGKWERAIPVAALYEQRRVRHAAMFPVLVDQMLRFTPQVISGRSPDRVDALVWALSGLLQTGAATIPQIRGL